MRQLVEPIQAVQAEKVKAKVVEFVGRVEAMRKAALKHSYLFYASGPASAFQSLDQVAQITPPLLRSDWLVRST